MVAETGDWPEAVRRCLPEVLPCGLVVATVRDTGLTIAAGPPPWVLSGATTEVGVLLDQGLDLPLGETKRGSVRRELLRRWHETDGGRE